VPPARSPIAPSSIARGATAVFTAGGRRGLLGSLLELYGADAGLLANSGTAALTLALRAARASGRDTAAFPAYCCYDLVTAAVGAGVRVLLYDVVPETLEPDESSLERVLDRGARVLVGAHLFGVPMSADRLRERCLESDVLFIEDAAQEAGSHVAGRRAGAFGSFTVLSFGRGKGLTGGSGGALLARDDHGTDLLRGIGDLSPGGRGAGDVATATALWVLGRPALFGLPRAIPGLHVGETVYRPPTEPTGISAAAASIVRANMRLLPGEVDARSRTATDLIAACPPDSSVRPVRPHRDDVEAGWLRLPVLIDDEVVASAAATAGRLGIASGYAKPLSEVEAVRPLLVDPAGTYPGASRLATALFTLPTHGWLSERDRDALERWLGGLKRGATG